MSEFSISGGDDFDDFADEIEDLRDDLEQAIDRGVERTAIQVERSAKQNAPVDTGNLRASLRFQQLALGSYAVGTNVEYAPDVEFGTDPHDITPDTKEALKFQNSDGEIIFASRVEHPGTPAQPYLRPALQEHESDIADNIADEIERLVDRRF
jgi:phage protein, HK97 gp10 family